MLPIRSKKCKIKNKAIDDIYDAILSQKKVNDSINVRKHLR